MKKTALLLLFLGFLATSLKGQEDEVVKFKDGTQVSFKLLSDRTEEALPWRINLGLKPQFLTYSNAAFESEMSGAYQIGNKLQLTGRFGFVNSLEDNLEFSFSRSFKAGLGLYFTFASKTGIKETDIKVAGRDDMITNISYMLKDVKLRRKRLWEIYVAFGQFNTPMNQNVALAGVGLSPSDSLIESLKLTDFKVTNLELGISTRSLMRSYFRLQGKLRSKTSDSRWTAKVLIPLQRSFSTQVLYQNTAWTDFVESDRNFYEDYLVNMGFALEYDFFGTSSFDAPNLLYGFHFGLRYHPFVSGVTDLSPLVQAYVGFSMGWTKNKMD